MALKDQLDSIDDLPDLVKGFYVEQDGKFVISDDAKAAGIETETTLDPLKKAKDHERKLRQELDTKSKARISELETQLEEVLSKIDNPDLKRKSGDTDALLESQAKKFQKQIDEITGKTSKKDDFIKRLMVDSQAQSLASDLAVDGARDALLPHIKSRLTLDMSDDEPRLVILDKDGKPSIDTLDDLKVELMSSESLSRIIKGSKASGGGADQRKSGGGVPQQKKLSEMTVQERAAHRAKLRA